MRFVGFVAIAGLLFGVAAHAQTGKYAEAVRKAKTALTRDFKDPDSAKFRDLGIYKSTTGKGGVSVCGEVNAKNSYGAYAGFRRFVVSGDMSYLDDEENRGIFAVLGPALCHELVTPVR